MLLNNENFKLLESYKSLDNNWDGYKAKSISLETINNAKAVLSLFIIEVETFPLVNDGVQFEYSDKEHGYIEIEVYVDRVKYTINNITKEIDFVINDIIDILCEYHYGNYEYSNQLKYCFNMLDLYDFSTIINAFKGKSLNSLIEYLEEKYNCLKYIFNWLTDDELKIYFKKKYKINCYEQITVMINER